MDFNNTFTTVHLRKAIVGENLEEVKMILDHGVKVTPTDYSEYHQEQSSSPLRYYPLESEDTDEKIQMLKVLLDAGASMHVFCHTAENTMISRLLSGGKKRTIDTVLQYSNDFSEKFYGGNTLLHYLAANEDPDVVNVLRGRTFNVNLPNDKGYTPSLNAVRCGNAKMVEFLLKNGAKVTSSTNYLKIVWESFENPKSRHKIGNFVDIVGFLLKHGAKPWLPRTYFSNSVALNFVEPTFAHIALQRSLDDHSVDHFILSQINSSELFKNHFGSFEKIIEELKKITIYKSVTLYKLLTESSNSISQYVSYDEFEQAFYTETSKPHLCSSYYMKIIRAKVDEAIDIAKTREDSILIISKIAGFHCDAYPHVILKIINFLNDQDLKSLCLADSDVSNENLC